MPVQPPPRLTLDTDASVRLPDGLSLDEPTSNLPHASMRAQSGAVPWFQNAEDDLRTGGSRTMVGKVMGHMQGRGDQGYTGLQSGQSPEVADFMGSIPLGLTKMGKGGAEIGSGQKWEGTKDLVSGGMQTTTIPSAFMGGPAAEAAITSIPSRVHAGAMLGDITDAAGHIPVNLGRTMPELLRGVELGERGGTPSKPISDLWARANQTFGPTFREARDYYTNISQKSADEANSLKPAMKRQIGAVRQAFHGDMKDAADVVGRGEDYANAMKEYARASKVADMAKKIGKFAVPLLLGGGAAGGAFQLANKLRSQ